MSGSDRSGTPQGQLRHSWRDATLQGRTGRELSRLQAPTADRDNGQGVTARWPGAQELFGARDGSTPVTRCLDEYWQPTAPSPG